MTDDVEELTKTDLLQASLACSQYADLLGVDDPCYSDLKRLSTKTRKLAQERGSDE